MIQADVIVLNYNDYVTTIKFLINMQNIINISHIIVVDNASTDNSFEILQKYVTDKIYVIQSGKNKGYGYGNNYGIKYAKKHFQSRYILICNPDVYFTENTVNSLIVGLSVNKDATIVAPMMINVNGEKNYKCVWKIPTKIQYITFQLRILSKISKSFYYEEELLKQKKDIPVDCVAGSLFLLDTYRIDCNNLFDEEIFLYCEETFLGIKIKKCGGQAYLINTCYFIHTHSISVDKVITSKIQQARQMWKSRIYVLKKYMNGNMLEIFFAICLMHISLAELRINLLVKKILKYFIV